MDMVIGLIGAKGAGKTTAFEVIKELGDVQEITLASKLKDVCSQVFNIPRFHFDSHKYKEKELANPVYLDATAVMDLFAEYDINPGKMEGASEGTVRAFYDEYVRPHVGKVLHTPRQVAQYVGTEVLRAYKDDIHCTAAVAGVSKSVGVVTDLRFPNEMAFFSSRYPNFIPVYIANMKAEIAAGSDTHASEAHLKDLAAQADFKITNNDSIQLFEAAVRQVMEEIESQQRKAIDEFLGEEGWTL